MNRRLKLKPVIYSWMMIVCLFFCVPVEVSAQSCAFNQEAEANSCPGIEDNACTAKHIAYVSPAEAFAYEESRQATFLAPAIAIGTLSVAGIIAIASQCTHEHSSHSPSNSYRGHRYKRSSSYSHFSSYSSD